MGAVEGVSYGDGVARVGLTRGEVYHQLEKANINRLQQKKLAEPFFDAFFLEDSQARVFPLAHFWGAASGGRDRTSYDQYLSGSEPRELFFGDVGLRKLL